MSTAPFLLRHLSGTATGRFPVWMMRQAGRYLPEYRELRKKHTFWEMVSIPELASEVTLQPTRRFPIDAAILFSDILTLPWGLGIPIEMREGEGPVCTRPLKGASDFDVFEKFDAKTHTPYVGEALRRIRQELDPDRALIGFAGAPWTVGCYIAEGRSRKSFEGILRWIQRDPDGCAEGLAALGRATQNYLRWQFENGADLVQLFDTWVSEMPLDFFRDKYLPIVNSILGPLRREGRRCVYFPRHAHHLSSAMQAVEADVLGCDSLVPLTEVAARTQKKFALQGNLDPRLLLADIGRVRLRTRALVQNAREAGVPVVMNLGHGILPETPVENALAFLTEARTLWT